MACPTLDFAKSRFKPPRAVRRVPGPADLSVKPVEAPNSTDDRRGYLPIPLILVQSLRRADCGIEAAIVD